MPINHNNIAKAVKGKVVLITGGAGSIGSVIFKLCVENQAKKIICIDSSEYNTYKLMQSFHNKNNIFFETGDINDYKMMKLYFSKYNPDIVFHAAAHSSMSIYKSMILEMHY